VDDRPGTLPRPLRALQAGIVGKTTGATHGALFLLAVSDAAQARAWLAGLPVTPGDQQPLKTGGLLRQLAFTREGLQAIGALPPQPRGVDDADAGLARLPQEFIDGMEARAGLLGDVRGNHPDRWQRPRYRGQGPELELRSVHLVLIVRLADPARPDHGLHPRLMALQQQLDATPGLHRLATEAMRSWPQKDGDVREHFGFRDGLSQPQIRAAGAKADPVWDDGVRPGDVLLGHPHSRGGGVYPPRPDPLLDNGSFLVLRKIAQHVGTWQQVVQAGGRQLDPHFDRRPEVQQRHTLGLVAAKLMGRSLDGQPAVDLRHPSHGNRFNYDQDPVGSGCPFAAHVRRANPRTRNGQGVPDVPRLLRRGMSYGPRWQPGEEPGHAERGLFFMAYVGSIAEQFEVVQRWMAGGNSTGVASTHSDPFLGVPQAGRPRHLQWLDEQGQVQRVDLGEQPLTTLRWGLYLFVPSIAGLRHIAAGPAAAPNPQPRPLAGEPYDPRSPAFDAWRRVVQDADQRDTLWRRVRDSGGQLQTAYGLLVADKDQALDILRDDGQRYTVRGYGRRFGDSVGPGYLGMDRMGEHAGHDERAEASGINAAIAAIDEATAFEAAARHTRARLQELAAGLPATPPGQPKVVSVDVLDLGEQVLARLCTEWFGVPDGVHLKTGGTAAAEPPPRCPRDLVDVARYIFGPHPSAGVSAEGRARGQAIQAATLAWLQQQLGPDGQGQPPAPLPRLAQAVHQGLGHLGLPVVADTLAGILLGFTPSVFGNYSNLMRAWIDRGSDGARTLWDLQAMLLHADAPTRGYEAAREVLRPALIAQMRQCPIPTSVWREVASTPVPADATGANEPAKIVIGLHGVMQDPAAHELLMWGGAWRGTQGYEDLKALHACPGYGLSTGVLMGIVSALVLAGSLRVSPSPTIVYWWAQGAPTGPVT
jgi:Dyp-type peroxidase family